MAAQIHIRMKQLLQLQPTHTIDAGKSKLNFSQKKKKETKVKQERQIQKESGGKQKQKPLGKKGTWEHTQEQ